MSTTTNDTTRTDDQFLEADEIYLLPSHPDILSSDPLSVCGENGQSTTAWTVFEASVATFRAHTPLLLHLPNLIQDLAYSLHLNGKADVGFLREVIERDYPNRDDSEAKVLVDSIFRYALAMPTLFPTHSIPYLNSQHRELSFNKPQLKCLVAHQLLGTLRPPKGNTWGCTMLPWFSSRQALRNAVHGYISTTFRYFRPHQPEQNLITYEFYSLPTPTLETATTYMASVASLFDYLEIEPVNPKTDPFPHAEVGCTLISCHQSPGFGPACTQEELITAACPDILPLGALCVSPPVPSNAAIVAEGVIPTSHWTGQRREARLKEFNEGSNEFTFVLVDALELDQYTPSSEAEELPDLLQEHLIRDIHKAYVGFAALRGKDIVEISSPIWGAGAFGGDPVVKSLILAMAGALAGVVVRLSVDETRYLPSRLTSLAAPQKLLDVLRFIKTACGTMTVHQVWSLLNAEAAQTCRTGADVADLLLRSTS